MRESGGGAGKQYRAERRARRELATELSDAVLALNAGKVLAKRTPDAMRRDVGVRAAYLG